MRRIAFALFLFISSHVAAQAPPSAADFAPATPAEPFEESLARQVSAISAPALGAHVTLLASPAMEGRGLGARGLDAAIEYATSVLKLAGIAPFGAGDAGKDASWFQLVPLRRMSGTTGQIEIERRERDLTATRMFASGVDCLFSALPPQSLKGPIVFAGFGIREPQLGRDDYAGLDVHGRIVMLLDGVPPGPEWQKPDVLARYASKDARDRHAEKLETARKLGAAAVLAVEDEGFATSMAANVLKEERAFLAYDHEAAHEPPFLVRVSRAVACAVIGEDTLDAARKGAPRRAVTSETTATIRVGGTEALIVSRDILGILPGSDPALRDEAVVLGAHLDHLGVTGGVVHPGADDNASGVAALLEIAKTFASSPVKPRRTLVFALWTGEEEGKFGSGYYVKHPRWPLQRTAAYLNLDMIGHPWLPEEIRKLVTDSKLPEGEAFLSRVSAESFVEPGVPRGVPALEAALRRSARGNNLAMHIEWTDGRRGGSDYRDFARAGVPFIRFFGNFFPDYHKPGDTADRLDPAQIQRVARFAFATAWELVNR